MYHIVPEAPPERRGLRSGTYGFPADVDAATAQTVARAGSHRAQETQDLRLCPFIPWPSSVNSLGDERVRRAINKAIDRQEIVDAAYFGDAGGRPLSPTGRLGGPAECEFDCPGTLTPRASFPPKAR